MNTYILLRNNKETGPFTRAQLVEMGIKSSDLLWVECQSVCWQHPGEISELRSLLSEKSTPVQDDKKGTLAIHHDSAVKTTNDSVEITFQKKEDEKFVMEDKKLVFVELPANVQADNKEVEKPAFTEPDSDTQKYGGIGHHSANSVVEKVSPSLTVKYCRPLDEIKEMYVKNMEQEQLRPRGITAFKLPKEIKKIAVYAGFVLTGAIAMLLIKNTSGKGPAASQQNILLPPVQNTQTETGSAESAQINAVMQPVNEQKIFPTEGTLPSPGGEKRSATSTKKILTDKTKSDNASNQDSNQEVIEVTEVKPVPADIISSMVSIKANHYIVGSFGGIRNLEMTLQNESKYLLDKVTVELKYLNPEGIILKTEHLHFQSVYPGGTETIAVKKSKRGTKLSYKITKIESKETAPGTTGL